MRRRKAKEVFILKKDFYTEITYQELWKLLDTDPEYENKHFPVIVSSTDTPTSSKISNQG